MSSAPTPHQAHTEDKFVENHNFWTHQIFPARTKLKDVAYWVTELFAAIYLLILILGMGLTESPSINDANNNSFTVMGITDQNNNLMNCEFAWITLAYSLKYLIYIIDTVLMMQKKYSTAVDLVPVVLNFIIWVIWTVYGFTCVSNEIWAGARYRMSKDELNYNLEKNKITQDQYNTRLQANLDDYNSVQSGTWIWIPCLIAAIANLACWIMGLSQKRSTLFTNAAISTWLIPLQLFFFNLFLKGSWFLSSYKSKKDEKDTWTNSLAPNENAFRKQGELFDARYIFIVIYFGSWICLVFAAANIVRSIKDKNGSKSEGIKYLLYSVFFISNFIWCLWMDAIYMETYVTGYLILVISSIVSIVVGIAIAILSFMEKFGQNEQDYFNKHAQSTPVKPQ
jgi:hypothetical protein